MVRGNAIYESQYLLGTSIARPLIAKAQIEIAREFGATALAHGATGKGNDQCRFELTFSALAPDLKILAPWRDADFRKTFPGRQQMIEYCRDHNIDVEASASKPYSMDRNLWHISYEAGILEDPWFDPTTPDNREMYKLTVDPEVAPDEAKYIELDFEQGDCVAIDGQAGTPSEIVKKLNEIAGKHGIGRVDLVENRQLETLTMDRDLMHLRDSLIPRYAELIYYGFWYAPEREALQALIDDSQKTVSGTVRLKLYKGNITTVGRKSDQSLYDMEIASMDDDESDYAPEDAGGFIRLHALRLKERARKQGYSV
jgi:argininosuccinate synthase